MVDPVDEFVQDGRFVSRPYEHYRTTSTASIDLDVVHARVEAACHRVYDEYLPFRQLYSGSPNDVTKRINAGIAAMLDLACAVLYNRLRNVAEMFRPDVLRTHMNTRAPVSPRLEFPRYIAVMFSSIGPLRLNDNFEDTSVIYVTNPNYAYSYGRANRPALNTGLYFELMENLRTARIPVAAIDGQSMTSAFFMTCSADSTNGVVDVFTTLPSQHYTREDAVMSLVFGSFTANTSPFQSLVTSLGYVDDADVTAALARVAPPGPPNAAPDDPPRLVAGLYRINSFGFTPAIAAAGKTPAVPRGIFVLGRGQQYKFMRTLVHNLSEPEVYCILAHRFRT